MKPRRLTVSRTHPESRARAPRRPALAPIPALRLQGRWLERAGFAIGRPVRVLVCPGVMVLEVIETKEGEC